MTYIYKCDKCGNVFEIKHGMNENPTITCPSCGEIAHRVIIGGTGYIMKSGGTRNLAVAKRYSKAPDAIIHDTITSSQIKAKKQLQEKINTEKTKNDPYWQFRD